MSHAELIADALEDDGTCFETQDGRSLDQLVAEAGGYVEYGRWVPDDPDNEYSEGHYERISKAFHNTDSPIRYVMPDGSAIVEAGCCWDLEGNEPFRMRGG